MVTSGMHLNYKNITLQSYFEGVAMLPDMVIEGTKIKKRANFDSDWKRGMQILRASIQKSILLGFFHL